MKELPTSTIKRTQTILKSGIKAGSKKAFSISKRAFLSKESYKKEKEDTNKEIAKELFQNISLLKGTAVKVAQALSMHNILPKEVSQELSKSYNQISPINKALVVKILKDEYKKEYKEVFKDFKLSAFASASLGQVHKATTFDGEKLAIKLQYPSIDKTIKSDIKLLKKLSFSKNILRIIKEVEERLYEEIDYENELKNNIEAFDRFKKLDVIVPKVYKKFSTKHILATSFIEGDDLYSWLMKNPSKKQKTKIANQMFSLFTHSIFKHKKIQADPNPANFIITKDNRLAMIDFGCMKEFDDEFIKTYKSIFHTYLCEDKEKILTTYKEIGFIIFSILNFSSKQ